MNDKADAFRESVHEKFAALESRMESIELNIGSTSHSLLETLKELRDKSAETKQAIAQALTTLERWHQEKQAESKDMIDLWIKNRETQKLAARAQKAESCAVIAIGIAQASIDEAERMILEALSAQNDANAVKVG